MVIQCLAPNCYEIFRSGGVSFRRFPLHNKQLLKKWMQNLKAGGFKPDRFSYICDRHFRDEDFRHSKGVRRLKPNVVPSIFQTHVYAGNPNSKIIISDTQQLNGCIQLTDSSTDADSSSTCSDTDSSSTCSDISIDAGNKEHNNDYFTSTPLPQKRKLMVVIKQLPVSVVKKYDAGWNPPCYVYRKRRKGKTLNCISGNGCLELTDSIDTDSSSTCTALDSISTLTALDIDCNSTATDISMCSYSSIDTDNEEHTDNYYTSKLISLPKKRKLMVAIKKLPLSVIRKYDARWNPLNYVCTKSKKGKIINCISGNSSNKLKSSVSLPSHNNKNVRKEKKLLKMERDVITISSDSDDAERKLNYAYITNILKAEHNYYQLFSNTSQDTEVSNNNNLTPVSSTEWSVLETDTGTSEIPVESKSIKSEPAVLCDEDGSKSSELLHSREDSRSGNIVVLSTKRQIRKRMCSCDCEQACDKVNNSFLKVHNLGGKNKRNPSTSSTQKQCNGAVGDQQVTSRSHYKSELHMLLTAGPSHSNVDSDTENSKVLTYFPYNSGNDQVANAFTYSNKESSTRINLACLHGIEYDVARISLDHSYTSVLPRKELAMLRKQSKQQQTEKLMPVTLNTYYPTESHLNKLYEVLSPWHSRFIEACFMVPVICQLGAED